MQNFQLFASPWWVNLFILLPFLAFYNWRGKLEIPLRVLFYSAALGIAFGYGEAAAVVYLRGAAGLLNSMDRLVEATAYQPTGIFAELPYNLLATEIFREATTLLMLLFATLISTRDKFSRWAIFFWIFAFWDIFYYIFLKFLIGWPQSFTSQDILFLIPVPWYSQVWYPILISLLLILAVTAGKKNVLD